MLVAVKNRLSHEADEESAAPPPRRDDRADRPPQPPAPAGDVRPTFFEALMRALGGIHS